MMHKHNNNEQSAPFFKTLALQSIITPVLYVHYVAHVSSPLIPSPLLVPPGANINY